MSKILQKTCTKCQKPFETKYKIQKQCPECMGERKKPFKIEYKFTNPYTYTSESVSISPKQLLLASYIVNPLLTDDEIVKDLKVKQEEIEKFRKDKRNNAFLAYLTIERFANTFKAADVGLNRLVKEAIARVRETKKDPADIFMLVYKRFTDFVPSDELMKRIKEAELPFNITELRRTVKKIEKQKEGESVITESSGITTTE